LIILTIIFWNLIDDISFSSLLFSSLVEKLAFEGELFALLINDSTLRFSHLGLFWVQCSNTLCPHGLGFYEEFYRSGWWLRSDVFFLSPDGGVEA
jgi:hypothetical protein